MTRNISRRDPDNASSVSGQTAKIKKETGQLLFGLRLKEHRKKSGISQKDFAEMMHVTRNTVINWETDKSKPDYNLIPQLCSLLGIRIHELFGMDPEGDLSNLEDHLLQTFRQLSPASRRVVDRMVSAMAEEEQESRDRDLRESFGLFMIRPGTVAAGVGDYVPEEAPEYTFLRRNHINADADGIVLVHGDSMEPVYHSGDYVYYQAASSALPGEDVIVDTEDGAVIKRMDSAHRLYSVNPAIPYPAKNDQNTLVIRGRVLGVVSSSDEADRADRSILEELFADEIRHFNENWRTADWI